MEPGWSRWRTPLGLHPDPPSRKDASAAPPYISEVTQRIVASSSETDTTLWPIVAS